MAQTYRNGVPVLFLTTALALGCAGTAPPPVVGPADPNAPPVPRFEARHRFKANPSENRPLAFSPDGGLLATRSPGGGFQIWDVENGRVLQSFDEWRARISSVAFGANGRQIFADDPFTGGIGGWDISTGKKVRAFSGAGFNFALSADRGLLAGGNPAGAIHLWDVTSGDERGRLRGHSEEAA